LKNRRSDRRFWLSVSFYLRAGEDAR